MANEPEWKSGTYSFRELARRLRSACHASYANLVIKTGISMLSQPLVANETKMRTASDRLTKQDQT